VSQVSGPDDGHSAPFDPPGRPDEAEMSQPGASDEVEESYEAEGPEEIDDDDQLGNRLTGATARSVLDYLAKALVDDPDAVVIEADEDSPSRGQGLVLRLHVAPGDMGRVIGRRGRMAGAIRALVRAAGAREGVEATVDIVD